MTAAAPPRPSARAAPDRRRQAALLAVPYAAFLLVLLGTEASVRAFLRPVSSLELYVAAPEQQAQFVDRRRGRICEGDPLLAWRLIPGLSEVPWELTLVTTNEMGIRYDRPLGLRPPGGFRIVCLGDSVTFGYRVPLVFPSRPRDYDPERGSYPVLMERRLRALVPDRPIEVIPLAVPGYSSHQGLAWLRRDGARLQPDIVTPCFGWNDIGRRKQTDRDAVPTGTMAVAARALVARSQALSHAVLWLRKVRPEGARREGAVSPMRVPRETFVDNMLEIAGVARSHGAVPVLIGPVYRDPLAHPDEAVEIGAHRDALRRAAARAGVDYIEVPELTERGYPLNDRLFGEHIHPNHRGHRLLAERLLAHLAARSLLPEAANAALVSGRATAR